MNIKAMKDWAIKNNPQGMTKLAAKAEISVPLTYKIVNHGHVPHLEIIKKIAKAIGLSVGELIDIDNENPPPAA